MIPVSRKSERIKINIRVSVSDEIARCLGLGHRLLIPDRTLLSEPLMNCIRRQ
jgi:hypothetical protein